MDKKILGIKTEVVGSFKKLRKTVFCIGMAGLVFGGGAIGWRHFFSPQAEELSINVDEIEMSLFPKKVTFYARNPVVILNGVNITSMTREQQRTMLAGEFESMKQRMIVATYGEQIFTTTLENLGIQFRVDDETILDDLEAKINELKTKPNSQLRVPFVYHIDYTYSDEQVEMWIQSVVRQLNVNPVEPSLAMASRGHFNLTEGRPGQHVVIEQFKGDVTEVLKSLTQADLSVDVMMETVEPTRDTSTFGTVDTLIASAESSFNRAETGRASNVDRGASLVSGTLLMPGDEFSFNELVYPVTPDNGFHYGTIFMNGQRAQGIGGGICQVTSTVYLAQLRTGIIPTQRREHSLPVYYVPLGLDATMFIGQIDYRFVNTLDYPLYLNAYTQGGTLTVEFWSNSEALNGLRYEPYSTQVATTATTKSYDAFLRTYNASTGELISEEFLHRSTYRTN